MLGARSGLWAKVLFHLEGRWQEKILSRITLSSGSFLTLAPMQITRRCGIWFSSKALGVLVENPGFFWNILICTLLMLTWAEADLLVSLRAGSCHAAPAGLSITGMLWRIQGSFLHPYISTISGWQLDCSHLHWEVVGEITLLDKASWIWCNNLHFIGKMDSSLNTLKIARVTDYLF